MLPEDMGSRPDAAPGVERYSKRSLLSLLGVFAAGLLLLVVLDLAFSHLDEELTQASQTEQVHLSLDEALLSDLLQLETLVYKLSMTTGEVALNRIFEDVRAQIALVEYDLSILEQGGSWQRETSIDGGVSTLTRVLEYPPPKASGYVLEVIAIRAKLAQLPEMLSELRELLHWRDQALAAGDLAAFEQHSHRVRQFLQTLPTFLQRMQETAKRLLFQTQQKVHQAHQELARQQWWSGALRYGLMVLVVLLTIWIGARVLRQADRYNAQLRHHLVVLEEARRAAEQASIAKSDFLSNMSHELRTPLNAILGFAQLLETSPLSDEDREGVEEILRAGQHLLMLINEILDLSRIESGHVHMQVTAQDMGPLVGEVISLSRAVAQGRAVLLHEAELPPQPAMACVDPVRFKQVLLNLVSNAIKYNRPQGEVWVRLQAQGDDWRLTVQDTGMGIDPARQQQVFEAFNRLDAQKEAIEGTGIGLTITQHLVQLMHGRIGLESVPGQGSTFWVLLPRAEVCPPPDSDA